MAVSNSTDRFNGYVASLAIKIPCVVASTTNITLNGTQTVEGVALVTGDRVLVTGQTDPIENGIYLVTSSAWRRAPDFDGRRDAVENSLVLAGQSAGSPVLYKVDTAVPFIIGEDPISFSIYLDPDTIGGGFDGCLFSPDDLSAGGTALWVSPVHYTPSQTEFCIRDSSDTYDIFVLGQNGTNQPIEISRGDLLRGTGWSADNRDYVFKTLRSQSYPGYNENEISFGVSDYMSPMIVIKDNNFIGASATSSIEFQGSDGSRRNWITSGNSLQMNSLGRVTATAGGTQLIHAIPSGGLTTEPYVELICGASGANAAFRTTLHGIAIHGDVNSGTVPTTRMFWAMYGTGYWSNSATAESSASWIGWDGSTDWRFYQYPQAPIIFSGRTPTVTGGYGAEYLRMEPDGAVTLYHSNVAALRTTDSGAEFSADGVAWTPISGVTTLDGLSDTTLGTTQQYDLLYNTNGTVWADTAGLLRFNPALGLSLGNNLAIGWDLSTTGEVALLNFDGSDEFNIGNSAYAANLAATITTVTGQMAFTNPVADLTTPIIYIRTDADNVERRLINFWEGTVENGFYLQAEYAPNEPDNFLAIGCDKITGTDRAFAIGQDGSFIAFHNKPYATNKPGFQFDRGAEQVNAYYGRFFTIGRSLGQVDLSLDAGTNFSAYTGYWEGPESFGRIYGFKHGYDGANNRYVLIRKDGGADALVFQVPRTTGILDFQATPTVLGVPLGNATHTGEVTGATALTLDVTAISNKTELTLTTELDSTDEVLISDAGATLVRADVALLTDAGYF